MEKEFYPNMWLLYVLRIIKGRGENFSSTAAHEGHIGKRVFSETNPCKTIHSVVNFVRMISLWVNKAKYEEYEAFEKDCLKLIRYTWEFFRKYGSHINEAYKKTT